MEWEWDDAKDATNTAKHGISFAEALQVFTDSDGIEKEDLAHSSRTRAAFLEHRQNEKRSYCNRGVHPFG